jgi:general secretion pathway protein D
MAGRAEAADSSATRNAGAGVAVSNPPASGGDDADDSDAASADGDVAPDNSTATDSGTAAASAAADAGDKPVVMPAAADGSGDSPDDQALITMNFQNVEIPVLAKFISEITGKNFVLDESVRGKVSIISPTKVSAQQAYSIFQSVLRLKGFTTVQAGAVIKIVPSRDVRNSAELTQSQQPGLTQGDQYVTRMVKLRNVDAASVMNVVQPMVSHDGLVAAFPQDNTLILTDDAFNVQRLLRIIGSLDIQGVQQHVVVIPLKLAFAADLSQQIEKIMSARETALHSGAQGGIIRPGMGVVAPSAQGSAATFSVVADERTNSLIVLASSLEMREIKELVEKLDIRPPNETYRIHVYRLKYAPAAEMVEVLNGLLGEGSGPTTLSPQTGRNSLGRGSSLGLLNGASFGVGRGGFGGMGGGYGGSGGGGFGYSGGGGNAGAGAGGFGSSSGSRRGQAPGGGAATASTGGASGRSPDFENPVSITADPATNALVVSASPQDYETLKRVIDELDIPRVQVFVQAIIVEVSVARTKDIGVNFIGSVGGNTLGIGSLNFGQLQNSLGNPLGLSGLGIGLASGANCSIPSSVAASSSSSGSGTTVTAPCDLVLMTALQSDTHSNVLSAPTLLTADNEEAMIVVGQNLPFVGSSAANAGLPGQIFNSVDRQNVGITLDIVPQVSQGDYIKLDVYEEVSNVVQGTGNQATNPLGPTTTIRSASTTVLVQNHRTAVIGGLLSSEQDTGRQGVPFLSDVPVLGNLFSNNSRQLSKQNLLVFLTPHVVHTRDDLQALALDERQKFVRSLGRREVNNMPASQFQQLYQPTFNEAVSPQRDLMQSQRPAVESGFAPIPGAVPSAGTALPSSNPAEAGPSSRNEATPFAPVGSASVSSTAPPAAPARAGDKTGAATAPSAPAAVASPAAPPATAVTRSPPN